MLFGVCDNGKGFLNKPIRLTVLYPSPRPDGDRT